MRRPLCWLVSVSLLGLVVGAAVLVSLLRPNAEGRPPAALPDPAQAPHPDQEGSPVSRELREFVDRWLEEKGLNPFGDPKDTFYAGGTPLFDEAGGATRDRFELVIEKHPELYEEYLSRQETEGSSIDFWLEENGYGPWGERSASGDPAGHAVPGDGAEAGQTNGSQPSSSAGGGAERYLHVLQRVPRIAEEIGPPLSFEAKLCIDAWLEANNLNEFGDLRGTTYESGTPCLDNKSGRLVNRYLRVLHQHPFLRVILDDLAVGKVDP